MKKLLKTIYDVQPFKVGDYVYTIKYDINKGYKLSKTKYKIQRINLSFDNYNIDYDHFNDMFTYYVGRKRIGLDEITLFFNKDIGLKVVDLLNKGEKDDKDDGFDEECYKEIRKLVEEDRIIGNKMKKLYLTYQDYQSLGSLMKEVQHLCNSLMNKRGILTANEKEQKFILEGEFDEEDIVTLKKYGFREVK